MTTDVNWHRNRVAGTGNLLLTLTWLTLLVLLVEMGLNALQYQLISDAISGNFASTGELVERSLENRNYRLIEGIVRMVLEIAAGIARGLSDVAAGRTVPHEQAMARIAARVEEARQQRVQERRAG